MILEEECSREIADFFKRLESEIHRIMDEYWESELGLFHLNKVSDIIQESRQEYYDILFKYCQIQYLKGREATERRFYRQLEMISVKADVTITRLDDLFKPDPTIRYNLNNKVFQASTHTMDRVDSKVMKNISQSYNEGLGIDEAKRRLTVEYNGLKSWEAQRIARTEINSAQNDGAFDVYGELGVEYQQWWTAQDERVRQSPQADHRVMHGKVVKVGTAFSNGLLYPGDRQGKISQWINCRCTTLPFLMPLGKMAPVGMAEFTEADLIDIPDFEMPRLEDLMNPIQQVPQISQEQSKIYRDKANEILENMIKASSTYDFRKEAEFEGKMFDLIEFFEKENLDWEDFVDYEKVSKEIFKLQVKIDETESLYYRGIYEETQESLMNLLGRKGINYEDFINDSNRNAILKDIELDWYKSNYVRSFGAGMESAEKQRIFIIEESFPKETSRIAKKLNPNSIDTLPQKDREFYLRMIEKEKRGLSSSEKANKRFKDLKRILNDERIILKEDNYDFYARHSMDYDNLKRERYKVLKIKGYDFDIFIGEEVDANYGDILHIFDRVPKKLLNQHDGKVIFSSSSRVYGHQSRQICGGFYSPRNNEIVVFTGDYDVVDDVKRFMETLAHECGHRFDANLGKTTRIGNEYFKIAEAEGDFVSSYGRKGYVQFKTYYSEDFAEAMAMYVRDPKRLKKNFPMRYEFIDNLFKAY